ncbi:hypothetical protein TI03_04565 [Achromatium sp. WMS1]|nr:hypothetical protein TI03_04565 [Achromatium sp. WMS1]
MSSLHGILYIVATPIGNLADISQRAIDILTSVDLIAAEDTRQTMKLLQAHNVKTSMLPYHDHNENEQSQRLINLLLQGSKIALVSDAGTPLISDPGFRLVHEARKLKLTVIPIPGACALISALSASGLPSDRFLFLGFLPKSTNQRIALLQSLITEPGTLIFYEAGSRLQATLSDLATVFVTNRHVVLARELTKIHENFLCGMPDQLVAILAEEPKHMKGEHVLLVEGAKHQPPQKSNAAEQTLRILLEELPIAQAAKLAARLSGNPRNELYKLALTLQ